MILNYMFHSTVADGLGLGFQGCGSPTWLNALDEVGSFLSLSYPVYKMELGMGLSVYTTEPQKPLPSVWRGLAYTVFR